MNDVRRRGNIVCIAVAVASVNLHPCYRCYFTPTEKV